MADIFKKYSALKQAWESRSMSSCGKLLDDLKITITTLALFPTEGKNADQKELLVIREILEIGAQYSVEVKDIEAFERYMAYLKTYYMDYAKDVAESAKMYELLGLNLLRLLAQNRLVEFHTELELLPPATLRENPYIAKSVKLEQFIMEGSYNKVIEIKDSVPAESYRFFMDILMCTIRDEIASCVEKAYADISVADCAKMLNLTSKDMDKLVKERGWKTQGGRIVFAASDMAPGSRKVVPDDEVVPTRELAEMVLAYAKEMEKIV